MTRRDSIWPSARLVSLSASGRFVAIRQVRGVDVVDALGTAPRASREMEDLRDFACVGGALWVVTGGALRRFSLEGGNEASPHPFEDADGRLLAVHDETAATALWWGTSRALIRDIDGSIAIDEVEAAPSAVAAPIAGRHFVVAEGASLRFLEPGRGELSAVPVPRGRVRALATLFGGRALASLVHDGDSDSVNVMRPTGELVHHVKVPKAARWAVATSRGLALIATEPGHVIALDLRLGKPIGRAEAPVRIEELALDAAGRYAAIAGFHEDRENLSVLHVSYAELFGGRPLDQPMHDADRRGEHMPSKAPTQAQSGPSPAVVRDLVTAEPSRSEGYEPAADAAVHDSRLEIPDVPFLALHPLRGRENAKDPTAAIRHLDARLNLAGARAARAIARAWHSGRLSVATDSEHPFEREVLALIGAHAEAAQTQVAATTRKLAEAEARIEELEAQARAAGRLLPLDALAHEFSLSHVAREILVAVAAPALRGEVARLYGILANDESRPSCDAHLLELLLAGTAQITRHDIARELLPDSPLVRNGLVRVHPHVLGQPNFHPLTVDPVLLSPLRGEPLSGLGPGSPTRIRRADRALEELAIPRLLLRDLVVAVAREPEPRRPLRLVLTGRPGSGRHAVLAALAHRAGRVLAVIDCERITGQGSALADELRAELRRAGLRGAIPCIDGLEAVAGAGAEGAEAVREVLRSHPGPVLIRIPREFKPPIDPGFHELDVPPMSESDRLAFWEAALVRRGLRADRPEELAARFRIGAGTIEAVIDEVCMRRAAEPNPPDDASAALDEAARQHIDTRLGAVATRVARLARWEQVALPDDVLDSIREFIGRVKHRRTVYESWGFDAKMSTSRGLSALFYGPPGTGKSMVAGLIARELALDLYRVDLARITSKWIGETEKNLAQVFDAAEDGQSIILFDEADSLFAKRTEVKSSVDRYANLEVNYLLQRLDSFEGIAILTTNQEGSLDTAFKRRLSLRLAFPFPDEDMRVKLWAAHIPPEVPTAGSFDFDDLARRFPMSGGYIRNSTLRAAFLAAQEDVQLSQDHLVRAIHLEYREMGKLAPGGKME